MEPVPNDTVWLVAPSDTGLLSDAIPIGHFGLSEVDVLKWADEYRLKGFDTRRVNQEEYFSLIRQSKSSKRN